MGSSAERSDQKALFLDETGGSPDEEYAGLFAVSLLGLSSVKGLGRKGIHALFRATGGDLPNLWEKTVGDIGGALGDAKIPGAESLAGSVAGNRAALLQEGERRVIDLARRGVGVVPRSGLPHSLREAPDAPPWLFVQGDPGVLNESPAVAVVGTRGASEHGRRATRRLVRLMSAYPVTLVSGLAEGIDEEAHRASLHYGLKNVAFLGHGIDFVFPAATKSLRQRIVDNGGAVVTEYLPGEHYKKQYFVERNRLQAAVADLVIPVEAKVSGGTAHTVRFAQKYGRPLAGIKWKGENGILEKLDQVGVPVFDITEERDRVELDGLFRALCEHHDRETYALSLAERELVEELGSRSIRKEDIERLVRNLERIAEEAGG